MSTIKVGIIGCGGIANGKHMPSLKTVAGVEQVAFCDIDASKAEKAAQDLGYRAGAMMEPAALENFIFVLSGEIPETDRQLFINKYSA